MTTLTIDEAARTVLHTNRPLVIDELTAFYTGPLRDALRASGISYSYGEAGTGQDFDDMAFDQDTMTALVEVVGDGDLEAGRVIGYGRGAQIVFEAVSAFTDQFGTPATFVAELNPTAHPRVIRDVVAKIVR